MRRPSILAIPALVLSILACNLPTGGAGSEAEGYLTQIAGTLTATAQQTPAATSSPTVTATSTLASTAAATNTTVVCNRASFVQDVTVPDGADFDVNEEFTKTWRLRNVGSCTWTSDYDLVFDSGDHMSGPNSQQLTNGSVGPGQTIDVSVDLKAPANAGTYKGFWRLRASGGEVFGLSTGAFWVQIDAHSGAVVQLPPWPVTKTGDSGPVVRALQHLLRQHGEDLPVDGLFGPVTKAKLQHFQGQNGLVADGIAGAQTWPALIVQRQQGSSGQAVRAIQTLLKDKYGYNLNVDGDFGPITDDAVRDFQDDHNLDVDGIVGPQTWRMLVGS